MTHLELLGGETVGGALHFLWSVERDGGDDMLVTVKVPSPRAGLASVHTVWADHGTGDAELDRLLVKRTNAELVRAEVGELARQWMSAGRRPPNGLSSRGDGRRLAAVA